MKPNKSQWMMEQAEAEAPEYWNRLTPEAQQEMAETYSKQDKIAKSSLKKQSKKPPF